jgi:hypothetical protein
MFAWTYLDQSGNEVGSSPRFDETDEAENWIGDSWPNLLENGVEAVVLFDHARGRRLYRMGLGAE